MDNREQLKAISHGDGPLLVLAGPGSGKTFVLTRHIRYLIRDHHVPPQQILVITFTRASALEMKSRFFHLMEGSSYPVSFGTFHAFFFQLLREYFHYRDFEVMPGRERNDFIKKHISGFEGADFAEAEEELNLYFNTLQRRKEEKGPSAKEFETLLKEYRSYCMRVKKLDFDDMANLLYTHLTKSPDMLSALQNRFRYILIDEFQDINFSQYRLIRMLAKPRNNLFLVGDDDQAIYAFRGSDPKIMLELKQEYADIETIQLKFNYRSDRSIVSTAGALICDNKSRYAKEIQAVSEGEGSVSFLPFESKEVEYKALLQRIRQKLITGTENSMAVIFRNNAQLEHFASRMIREKLPFLKKEKVRSFYSHPDILPVLAMLRASLGELMRSDLLSFMNRPYRGISRDALQEERVSFESLCRFYRDTPKVLKNIEKLKKDLNFLKGKQPYPAVAYIRRGMGYDTHLQLLAKKEGEGQAEKFGLMEELSERVREFGSVEELLRFIEDYESRLEVPERMVGEKEGVQLYTMHGSKGLEFDTVFLPQVLDNILPGTRALTMEKIEEERRLFYVAMTRAKHELFISFVENEARGLQASCFLEKLRKLQGSNGRQIFHIT